MEIFIPNPDKITIVVFSGHADNKNKTILKTFNLYYEHIKGNPFIITLPNTKLLSLNIQPQIDYYNQQKGYVLEESESIHHYLTQILIKYFTKNDYPKDQKPLKQKDFMGKRDILSNYLIKKENLLHTIPNLSNKKLRKEFTSIFYDYIIDRNIFAHGIFVFDFKKQQFYIEHIHASTKKTAYAKVNRATFTEFNKVSRFLRETLNEINTVILKK